MLPSLPLVAYARWPRAPLARRYIGSWAWRLLPRRGRFAHRHPNGAEVEMDLADELGRYAYVYGGFEPAELRCLLERAGSGRAVFDVGANVGYHTTALARHRPRGLVVAVEPSPANLRRLRQNLARNGAEAVHVHPCAVGNRRGSITLHLATDSAYLSTRTPVGNRSTGQAIEVPLRTLDDIWEEEGRPEVAVVKIDVEGAELEVLEGARQMLERRLPDLLLEANDDQQREALSAWLAPLGYRPRRPPGFERWNYLFCAAGEGGVR
jgi:FkbM family methyltransferase